MRKMLLGFALIACGIAFTPPASAEQPYDPGKDSAALTAYAAAESVISAREDVIAVPEVASIPNDHDSVMRNAQAVAGAPVLPAIADPERTCQEAAIASPREHAVISHPETFIPAKSGRHGLSWRLHGSGDVRTA